MSKCQLPLPAPVRFWDQFLNGSLITASTEKANVWVFFFFFPNFCSGSANGLFKHAGPSCSRKPQGVARATAAETSCPPSPELLPPPRATTCTVFWLCAELTPLPREPGREKAWGLDYNKASLAMGLSGKGKGTGSPFSGNSPLAPGPRGEGHLRKKDVPITATLCNFWLFPSILSVPFAFSLQYLLCLILPGRIVSETDGAECGWQTPLN